MRSALVLVLALVLVVGLGFLFVEVDGVTVELQPDQESTPSSETSERLPAHSKVNSPSAERVAEEVAPMMQSRQLVTTDESGSMTFRNLGPSPVPTHSGVQVHFSTPSGLPLNSVAANLGPQYSMPRFTIHSSARRQVIGEPLSWDYEHRLDTRNATLNNGASFLESVSLQLPDQRGDLFIFVGVEDRVLAQCVLESDQSRCELSIDLAAFLRSRAGLRARFVDRKGKPTIPAVTLQSATKEYKVETLRVDDEGRVAIDGLVAEGYKLMVTGQSIASHTQDVLLEAGEVHDLGSIVLSTPTSIRGQLFNRNMSVQRRTIELRDYGEETVRATAETNDRGIFRFRNIEPGRYLLQLEDDYEVRKRVHDHITNKMLVPAPMHLTSGLLHTDTLGASDVEVRLPLLEAVEVVLQPTFTPGNAFDCRVRDVHDQVVLRRTIEPANGDVSIWLAPGDYVVDWSREGTEIGRAPLEVQKAKIRVELPEAE